MWSRQITIGATKGAVGVGIEGHMERAQKVKSFEGHEMSNGRNDQGNNAEDQSSI